LLYTNRDLKKLIIPLIIEQVLNSAIGTIDTLMVSNVGSAALSGVSLVDSINKLVIFLFTALATGGAIVCAQYLGRREQANADKAARQVLIASVLLSVLVSGLSLLLRNAILRTVFGTVEDEVMAAAQGYYRITILSYPFIAIFDAGSALYRAAGNSKLSMKISMAANLVNIAGNYLLLFVFPMGVKGAALSTLVSYCFSAVFLLVSMRNPHRGFDIGKLRDLRLEPHMIWVVLSIGIPTGIENAMFQFGKLMVQSTVSTLGTVAIAANALVVVLEFLSSMPSQAIGTGLMTVAGQCIGAGRLEEAKYYIRKLTLWAFLVLAAADLLVFAAVPLVIRFAGMNEETAALVRKTMLVITIVKPFAWALAFVPANGMKAAGDVKFGMLVSSGSMWLSRVALTALFCRVLGAGLLGIWCGYFIDWVVRSVIFTLRYRSGKWAEHHVIP